MDVLHDRCAGLDVHKDLLFICVLIGTGRKVEKIKLKFGTFRHQLLDLRARLVGLGVTHVVMESTGVYWMPVYEVLDSYMTIVVGNAQHIMNVPGRKTDETDAEWLAKLLRHGLIKPSFVPERTFRELRQLTRYRRALVQVSASEQNRVEKHLQIAGIKLSSVTSKPLGVSGMDMLEHIAKGVTDAGELAALARGRLRKKMPQLRDAFATPISTHTQQLIAVQLDQMNRLDATVAELEAKIDDRVKPFDRQIHLLDTVPGIDRKVAIEVLAETGVNMAPWEKHRQFAAMAGLCPGNYISAGKRLKNRSRRGNPYLKSILVQAACSAINTSGSYFQNQYKHLKQRRGHKRAIVAVAHAMVVAIYHMLKNDEPYRDPKPKTFDTHTARHTQKLIADLQKRGYTVTLNSTTS